MKRKLIILVVVVGLLLAAGGVFQTAVGVVSYKKVVISGFGFTGPVKLESKVSWQKEVGFLQQNRVNGEAWVWVRLRRAKLPILDELRSWNAISVGGKYFVGCKAPKLWWGGRLVEVEAYVDNTVPKGEPENTILNTILLSCLIPNINDGAVAGEIFQMEKQTQNDSGPVYSLR